jgi:hypothetical protein
MGTKRLPLVLYHEMIFSLSAGNFVIVTKLLLCTENEVKESVHNEQAEGNHFMPVNPHHDQDTPQNIALSIIAPSAPVTNV